MNFSRFEIANIRWLDDIQMFGGSVMVGLENDGGVTGNLVDVTVRFKGTPESAIRRNRGSMPKCRSYLSDGGISPDLDRHARLRAAARRACYAVGFGTMVLDLRFPSRPFAGLDFSFISACFL